MTIRNLCLAGAAALAVGMAADDAHALGVNPGDPGFIATFNYEDTLLARLTFALQDVDIINNIWTFAVEVVNMSANDGVDRNRLVSFGYRLTPQAKSTTIVDNDNGAWAGVTAVSSGDINVGGFKEFQINTCVFAGQNCAGGANEGIEGGETSNLVLAIQTDGPVDSLFFTNAATRWQSIAPNGDGSIAIGGDIAPIPLPPVGFMLLGALGALAFAARRRQVEKV